jgi:hypothetical protein
MPVFTSVIRACLPLKFRKVIPHARGIAVSVARIVAVPETLMDTPVILII